MEKKIPVTFEDLPGEFPRYGKLVRVVPGGTVLPHTYKKVANAIYNFEYRKDDICLFTLPKSGTTWTAEILWAMTHIDEMDRALTEKLNQRYFLIDNDFVNELPMKDYMEKLKAKRPDAEEDRVMMQLADLEEGRRFIWSHLPFDLQNPDVLDKCKVVTVMRHPKDNMFSRYQHFKNYVDISLEQIAMAYVTGNTIYGDYWHHIKEVWKRKGRPNLHTMFYEDMKADIMSELRRLNEFLGTNLNEEQLKRVAEHTSFGNMKAQSTMVLDPTVPAGTFFFKGEVGSSKGQLSPDLDAEMDNWIKENALKVDPDFKYVK
ncbi:luciferin sulfotransferase-like [Palaemon carinicauda]|uniref:luciferin sulfotransferase-like n=1 Tax=Palaemon carinicauda TaxID=392227 RepID=UPI0035B57EF1